MKAGPISEFFMALLRAFFRALSQLRDPALRRPLVLGFSIALAVFAALFAGANWLLFHSHLSSSPWLDRFLQATGSIASLVLAVVLFPGLMMAVSSLFLEGVVEAVERRFYPGLALARPIPWSESLRIGARLFALTVVLNGACLPLYLVPGVDLVVFPLVNGALIGREYWELVALRRLEPSEADRARRGHSLSLLGVGACFALLTLVPGVGFLVPVLAAATMTHLFHGWRR